MTRHTALRALATLGVTGLCTAYILWRIDLHRTVHVLATVNVGYFGAAAAIAIVAICPMAWRWQRLLAVRGIHEPLGWLMRTSYVSYAVSQVLPTSLGGDASRIFEGSRRRPGEGGTFAGSVLLERLLGG